MRAEIADNFAIEFCGLQLGENRVLIDAIAHHVLLGVIERRIIDEAAATVEATMHGTPQVALK